MCSIRGIPESNSKPSFAKEGSSAASARSGTLRDRGEMHQANCRMLIAVDVQYAELAVVAAAAEFID